MLKHSKFAWLGCALVLGLGLAVVAQTTFAASQDALVTDPDTLEAMGFERDVQNVYIAPGVDLEGAFDTGLSPALGLDAQTSLFPSGSTDYSPVSGKEFIGRADTTGTQWLYNTRTSFDITRAGTERFADAQVTDLPNGGLLDFLRGWWFDDLPQNLTVFLFEVCQPPFAGGAPFSTVIATIVSGLGEGSSVDSIGGRTINTFECKYLARVRFDAASLRLALHKIRVQFRHP